MLRYHGAAARLQLISRVPDLHAGQLPGVSDLRSAGHFERSKAIESVL